MGRRKKAADSNTGVEGVHKFDGEDFDAFMDRLDDKQKTAKSASMAVANEYRLAEKNGHNRLAMNWIRKLEALPRGVMLTVLSQFDLMRKHRLANKESDLFEEGAPPPDPMGERTAAGPEDEEEGGDEEEAEEKADEHEGEPAPAAVEAAEREQFDNFDASDLSMRAGAADRKAGKPITANPHPAGSAKFNRYRVGWTHEDDKILDAARGGKPAAEHRVH